MKDIEVFYFVTPSLRAGSDVPARSRATLAAIERFGAVPILETRYLARSEDVDESGVLAEPIPEDA